MPDVVSFDAFEVHLLTHELRKKGVPVPLQEQPFRILEILIRADGRLISREQLTAALWPSGTFVDFDRGLNTAVNKLRAALGDSAENPSYIKTVGRRGYRFIGSRTLSSRIKAALAAAAALLILGAAALALHSWRTPPRAPIHSIAVLPLVNLSKDPDQGFFADGMTDEVITNLAKIHGLEVISRQSVMRFKSSSLPLPQIARQLGVDAIVEGSVVRQGGRLRVTAQLVDARSDRHLWANDYERQVGDVLALQDDMAADIAEQIGAKLVTTPPRPSGRPNTAAYLLYLRGRSEWNEFPPNFGPAMALFEEAIKQDPNFAPAYAGLADCYATRRFWDTPKNPDDAQKARSLANRALQLDRSLAEAYTTLAGLDDDIHDHRSAEANFRRAIAANPNYIIAHQWHALHLVRLRRFDDAIREARIAQRLDPLSPYALAGAILVLDLRGNIDQAIELRERSEMLFPDLKWTPFERARMLREAGREHEAMTELLRGLKSTGPASLAAAVESEYQKNGCDAALRLYLRDPHRTQRRSLWASARFHALLHDREETLSDLERSYARGESFVVYANAAHEFDFVRGDPRFRTLIAKMNLD